MTQKVLFFIFPVLLVLLPVIIHNRYSPFMAKTWLRIITVPDAKKVPANILFVLLSFFIPIYYAVFPKDWGITPSIFIVVFLWFTKISVKALRTIRRNHRLLWSITLACLIMPFIPHLLSLAMTLAFMLESSYFYPTDDMEKYYDEHADEADVDKKFIETYFR
mgnify:CR=1 FL=1